MKEKRLVFGIWVIIVLYYSFTVFPQTVSIDENEIKGVLQRSCPFLLPFNLERTEIDNSILSIYLTSFNLRIYFEEGDLDQCLRGLYGYLNARDLISIKGVVPFVRKINSERYVPIIKLLPPITPPPKREHEIASLISIRQLQSPIVKQSMKQPATGFLEGKFIYLSPGHGWYWDDTLNRWATQRGNTNDVVEDLSNAESVTFLVTLLRNGGAQVIVLREPDWQTNMVIVDNDDGSLHPERGIYEEFGEGIIDSTLSAFGYRDTYYNEDQPFLLGTNRLLPVSSSGVTAWARWTPNIPEDGYYEVYVSYTSYRLRAQDAHYRVYHQGGETDFYVNQQIHGRSWVYLGTFYFKAGLDPEHGSVVLYNDSSMSEEYNVSADAVRFGGGMGIFYRGNTVSNRPRWEEASRYHTQFMGAPPSVYDYRTSDSNDDVVARSRFTAWLHEDGEDALYISWHTNAANGSARGTESYCYGPNPPNGDYNFQGTPGSDTLTRLVHNEVISMIRQFWDPNWRDRGVRTAYFGELNPSHNPETPSMLIEVAFHDNVQDAMYILHPRFRYDISKAIYRGIVKYFAQRDNLQPHFLPETPLDLKVIALEDGKVEVSWTPPPSGEYIGEPATGYYVYLSKDGYSFDNGHYTQETSYIIDNIDVGELIYVKVTAVNEGGESLPTPTLAAISGNVGSEILIVYGYTRLDREQLIIEDLTRYFLSYPRRMFLKKMNEYNYINRIGEAIKNAGYRFDTVTPAFLSSLDLNRYQLILWLSGNERGDNNDIITREELELLERFSGCLVLTGAQLIRFLNEKYSQFLSRIGVNFNTPELQPYEINILPELSSSLTQIFVDNGRGDTYPVLEADSLRVLNGEVLAYYSSTQNTAIVGVKGQQDSIYMVFGFPIEVIQDSDNRNIIVADILRYCEIEENRPPILDGGVDSGVDVMVDIELDDDTSREDDYIIENGEEVDVINNDVTNNKGEGLSGGCSCRMSY